MSSGCNAIINANYRKTIMSKTTDIMPKTTNKESPEQPQSLTESVTPLSPIGRADKAYELVYGDDGDNVIRHGAIDTAESANWYVRSYIGTLFASPTDNPLRQRFSNLDELLTWFNATYPLADEASE